MTTSTLPGLFDRVGLELAALQRRIMRLATREPPSRPFSLPPLTRMRAAAAPGEEIGIDDTARLGSNHLWIGGEPERVHVIGDDA